MRECFFGSHSVPADARQRARRAVADHLLAAARHLDQVHRDRHAGGQPGRRRHPGADRAAPARRRRNSGTTACCSILLGIFGAALLYGDGMITPAITVLGAVEGLKVATPLFDPYVVPIAVVILIGVFAIQRHGTHRVGRLFGPIMVVVVRRDRRARHRAGSSRHPVVLTAVDPAPRRRVLRRARLARVRRARRRVPGGHRRRGAVRGHGALRQTPDPAMPGSRWCCRRCS